MGTLHITHVLTFALAFLVSSADSEAPGINLVLDSFFKYIYIQNP